MKRKMLLILGGAALILTSVFAFKPSAKFTTYYGFVSGTCTLLNTTGCVTSPVGTPCVSGVTTYYTTTNCSGTGIGLYQPSGK
jgi:hypothetical protein